MLLRTIFTKIVVGKPQRRRWLKLRDEVVLDRIIRQSEDIDVYVVSGRGERAKSGLKINRIERILNWKAICRG